MSDSLRFGASPYPHTLEGVLGKEIHRGRPLVCGDAGRQLAVRAAVGLASKLSSATGPKSALLSARRVPVICFSLGHVQGAGAGPVHSSIMSNGRTGPSSRDNVQL